MSFEYNGVVYRDLEPQVRYDAEQVQALKQADVTMNESLQTINTELNGKLNKPTNPSAESAVTMLADGTVGTKLLSEIGGGGKLYVHRIDASSGQNGFTISIAIINTSSNPITDIEYIKSCLVKGTFGAYSGMNGQGAVSFYLYLPPDTYRIEGVIVDSNDAAACLNYSTTIDGFEDISRTEL